MFDKVKKAGLSVDEFAVIVGVSRVAAFNWKAGRAKPHPQLKGRVAKAMEFLAKLVELKKLPLKDGLSKEERKAKVAKLRDAFEKYSG